ncbi:hypothetical protein HK099_005974 [Clydaea vesicula]|uniref:F-box domain-containing protein n=1 Tax=Clydaea vesicula TaxID=447962 RepID=A0AAD5XUJ8_9FUNG|nr:hypothetical protein HK099_005974 [Clydaea vesicula]KAJ3381149.1 hypothetical protein HDU92_005567 [Lobulomyces angularis]
MQDKKNANTSFHKPNANDLSEQQWNDLFEKANKKEKQKDCANKKSKISINEALLRNLPYDFSKEEYIILGNITDEQLLKLRESNKVPSWTLINIPEEIKSNKFVSAVESVYFKLKKTTKRIFKKKNKVKSSFFVKTSLALSNTQQKKYSKINNFPLEILLNIVSHIDRKSDLSNICQINQIWKASASSKFWNSISFQSFKEINKFNQCLGSNLRFVESYSNYWFTPKIYQISISLNDIFQPMPNLTDLINLESVFKRSPNLIKFSFSQTKMILDLNFLAKVYSFCDKLSELELQDLSFDLRISKSTQEHDSVHQNLKRGFKNLKKFLIGTNYMEIEEDIFNLNLERQCIFFNQIELSNLEDLNLQNASSELVNSLTINLNPKLKILNIYDESNTFEELVLIDLFEKAQHLEFVKVYAHAEFTDLTLDSAKKLQNLTTFSLSNNLIYEDEDNFDQNLISWDAILNFLNATKKNAFKSFKLSVPLEHDFNLNFKSLKYENFKSLNRFEIFGSPSIWSELESSSVKNFCRNLNNLEYMYVNKNVDCKIKQIFCDFGIKIYDDTSDEMHSLFSTWS